MNNPKTSPWGKVQSCENIAEGIVFVSTAGHGGVKLDRGRNAKMPDYMRNEGGWYEEDCEQLKVAVCFPDEFFKGDEKSKEEKLERTKESFRDWFPNEYERFYNVKLADGESYTRDKEIFNEKSKKSLVVSCAWGSPSTGMEALPKGYVRVEAKIDSDPEVVRTFYIPEEEYKTRRFGFIVNPEVHQECFDEFAKNSQIKQSQHVAKLKEDIEKDSICHIVIGKIGHYYHRKLSFRSYDIETMKKLFPSALREVLEKVRKGLQREEQILNKNLEGFI